MNIIALLLFSIINILEILLFAYIVLSWIKTMNSTLWQMSEAVEQVVDPLLAPLRKIVPDISIGGVQLDMSVLAAFFILYAAKVIIGVILATPF